MAAPLTPTEKRLVEMLVRYTDYTEQMARETVLFAMRGTVDVGGTGPPLDTNVTADGTTLDLDAMEATMRQEASSAPRPIDEALEERRGIVGADAPEIEVGAPRTNRHHIILTGTPRT